ncbi:MAG: hypothetical protein ACLGSA_13615 [Acidobacteriota bacterium]
MKTAAFILFALVTAAAAALSTLVGTRYLTLERELAEARSQIEDISRERKRQEEEKMALRLERERIQSELEARFSEQRGQLEECGNQRQRDFQEILTTLATIQKRMTDIQVQTAPSAAREPAQSEADSPSAAPKMTDVPRGAVPTPEQEARKLDKAGDAKE